MDEQCEHCGFDYGSVASATAARAIRFEAGELADRLAHSDPVAVTRRPGGEWSALEYGGHVRDVLLVQRERVLAARLHSGHTIIPMGRDERVEWREYEGIDAGQLEAEIRMTADWLARSLEAMDEDDWSRTVVYNYPQPATKTLRWLAAHTVHELVHHRQDVERLLDQSR
ncbi:DinB family protein [Microlunatus elymi]|uniref:DinB family protein n=1 Tax=Microlunatus elymi TaxID=2596828 RepID=A0A516PW57_9ACTN|nr:DinB family protein [Microlunatus elymi]QDP95191.1 DinB family protein [Microlunatus elymi]